MGNKELIEELDKQLIKARKRKKYAIFGWVTTFLFFLFGFAFPFLWLLTLLILIASIIDTHSSSKQIDKITLEKAKLK